MDNHADNFTIGKNYFTGLIDSDFGVFINRFYPRGRLQLRPTISLTNTNFTLIEGVHKYLILNGINHHITSNVPTVGKKKKILDIKRLQKCMEFSELFGSGCVVRRPHLDLLNEYCYDRLRYVFELGWKQNNTPYTDRQKKIYDELVSLNMNYNYDLGYRNLTSKWLSGFLDGDGSVSFIVSGDRIIPTIDFTTESDAARENIKKILNVNRVKFDIRTTRSKAKKRLGKNKKKFYYNIYIRSFEDLYRLIDFLDGNVFAKSRQLSLMRHYLEIKKINRSNTDECWKIVNKVKFLNHNPNCKDISETNTQDT